MFKVISFLVLLLTATSLKAQDSLIIEGTINKNFNGKTISLEKNHYLDTSTNINGFLKQISMVENGKFAFSIAANTLDQYIIRTSGGSRIFTLSPKRTAIKFTDSTLKTYNVIGNNTDSVFRSLMGYASTGKFAPYEINRNIDSLIVNNPTLPLNIYLLLFQFKSMPDNDVLRLYELIPDSNKLNLAGKELKFIMENLMTGQILPDFSQLDTNGVTLKLSDLKGKYILVDFWASWCGPCRVEHPDLIKAFKKYGKKNFDILSFSLDDKKDLWLEAIKKDGVQQWKHVSDLTGISNFVSRNIFKVTAVPVNYLIDPSGKIIAKNLSGKQLLKKLGELDL